MIYLAEKLGADLWQQNFHFIHVKNKVKNQFAQSEADFPKLMTFEEQEKHVKNSSSSKIFK
jgi:hypothetical protein